MPSVAGMPVTPNIEATTVPIPHGGLHSETEVWILGAMLGSRVLLLVLAVAVCAAVEHTASAQVIPRPLPAIDSYSAAVEGPAPTFGKFLPLGFLDTERCETFWDAPSLRVFPQFSLTAGKQATTLHADVLADCLYSLRVSIGTGAMEAHADSADTDAGRLAELQRFFAGAGNVNGSVILPLVFVQSEKTPENQFGIFFQSRANYTLAPGISTAGDVQTWTTDVALEAAASLLTKKRVFDIVARYRVGVGWGSDTVMRTIGLEDRLIYGRISFGVIVRDTVEFSLSLTPHLNAKSGDVGDLSGTSSTVISFTLKTSAAEPKATKESKTSKAPKTPDPGGSNPATTAPASGEPPSPSQPTSSPSPPP